LTPKHNQNHFREITMNKNRFRIVFNAARGLRVAVAECARSFGKASTTVCAAVSLLASPVFAQIVADPSAPSGQRPTVLTAPNGVPLVNIQTPSAAGVSRNTYSQFDVNAQGAILNNSRTNVQTQLGGWVQGNPWLATGGARVILNEVNSVNPSQLRGFVEVAGQRAEVIIANPAGIEVNGGGFINASRATLTTGTPIMNGGSLDGYRVQGGSVTVRGVGLDARQTDHTAILARAIEVNAGIWANALLLVTGVNDVDVDQTTVQARPAGSGTTTPAFALDVAHLGGMYAGKITLVGTEAGVGVRNAGTIGATAGDVVLDVNGWLSNRGTVQGSANLSINVHGEMRNEKDIYAGGALNIETPQALTNSGLIAAHGDLTVQADSVNSTGSLAAGLNTDGSLKAAAARLDIQVEQQLTTQGNNLASGHLRLEGQALDISGSQTRAQTLNLRATGRGTQAAPGTGLIDSRNADVLADGNLGIDSNQLQTTGARLQALGDIDIAVTHLENRAGLIRAGGGIAVVAHEIDNRDTLTAAGADPLGVIAQRVHLTTGDLLNQNGALVAEENLTVVGTATGGGRIENTQGLLSAGATLDIHEATMAGPATARRLSITNTAGTLIADEQLAVTARSLSLDGDVLSQQDMTLSLQGDHTHAAGSRTVANRDLTLDIEDGGLHNSGALLAGRHLGFTATHLENNATGEISAGTTTGIDVTETLTNRGLIDGRNTRLQAQDLSNIGTGRIYGDVLAIQAVSLLNDTETVGGVRSDAVIAARERLDIGVQTLVNREGATVFSAGDMAMGGALDANLRADGATSGMAQTIQNQSATIEALGALAIATQTLENTNEHFTYTVTPDGSTAKIDYYTAYGYMSSPQDVAWSVVEYDGPPEYRDTTVSGTKILPRTSVYADAAFRDFYQGPTPFVEGHTVWFDAGDSGYSTWVPDTYGHDRDSPIWAALGMTPPAWNNPGQKPRTVYAADDSGQSFPPDPQALADWEARIVPWLELTARFNTFKSTLASQLIPTNLFRQYTETVQRAEVTSSQPARIVSGADMALNIGQTALNRNSHIVAGGTLNIDGVTVNNEATQVDAPTLRSGTLSQWTVVGQRCSSMFGCEPVYDWANAAYAESITRTVALPSIRYESNAASGQAPMSIGALRTTSTGGAAATHGGTIGTPAPSLPTSSLFTLHPQSTSQFLVETDPRFTNHRQWLSSDYMLAALSIDPATTQKRLGDGFYEQKLVREQVAALTGLRFLGDFTSDEQQYQTLMTAGATFAQTHQLRPGIALSAEMVAQLTSDIVWLVSESVTLPDGNTTQVLVPKVYALSREGDLANTGALLAGKAVNLHLSGDLTNAGTIHGRQVTQITAANLHNLGGQLGSGKTTQVTALQDIHNVGGTISALDELRLGAGRDINIQTTASQGSGDTGEGRYSSQGIDRVASLYVSNAAGVLIASAGRDMNLTAALVQSAGTVQMDAQRDIKLDTLGTSTSMDATRDERNFTRIEHTGEVGTQIQAGSGISLQAKQDIQTRSANLQAGGELSLQAGHDVSITAGEQSLSIDTAAFAKGSSALSSGSTEIREQRSDTTALSSSIGGERVLIRSAQDVTIHGSSVIGDEGATVQAEGDVNIVAAQTTSSSNRFEEHKSSGFSFSASSISYGSQQQSTDQENQGTGSVASTVGAIAGNVNITAGQTYTQVGSDVMAPRGDVNILARDIAITENQESQYSLNEEKFKQAGISLGMNSPLISTVQRMASTAEATGDTKDARMQALGAATLALQGQQVLDGAAQAANPAQAAGVSFSISLGSSQSESLTETRTSGSRGSTLTAGGDVNLVASGAGQGSTLLIQGSDVIAGETARLIAEGDATLQAAKHDSEVHNRQSSSSASVGIGFSVGASGTGFGLMASASQGKGQGDGYETVHRNTHVNAGNLIVFDSGGDTHLKGAVVQAEQVKANVVGNLHIESLQDTATYKESSENTGFSATIGAGGGGSINADKTRIDSEYASVNEQSGIRAGDGGFQVTVQGATSLKGGTITSTGKAVQDGLNRFDSLGGLELGDIQNNASYNANSSGVTVGAGSQLDSSGAGIGSDKGSASSTTVATISGIAGNTEARTGDAETGIASIFDKERVKDEVNAQVEITKAFGQQAVKSGAAFADDKAIELRRAGNEDEARKWDEGGEYRVALHAGIGLLGGGIAGAAGAASGAALMPALGEEIAGMNLPESVRQGLTQVVGAVVGSAASGAAGAATSLNQTAHNYVSHSPFASVRRTVSQENARLMNVCAANCTAEDFRRIDEQMVKLEAAGNLAEIARYGALTPQQGQQLAQLALELAPIYGSAESVAQLISGKSSLSGEEASRFWAAVGVVPVAGGLLKRLAPASPDLLNAVIRNNFYRDGPDPGITIRMYQEAAKTSTHNPAASEVVLGQYIPQNPRSYEIVAQSRSATYFSMPDWDDVQALIGADKMWEINQVFLDQQIAQGKTFVFTSDPRILAAQRPSSYLSRELRHLTENGYRLINEGGTYRAIK
jgi:filamentous hemagglutinin